MTTAQAPLIDLHTVVDPRGQVAATIPVAWCNEDHLLEKVKQAGFTNPHLYLVVRHKKTTKEYNLTDTSWDVTETHVVPLTSQLRYVNFASPGANEVRALVIDIPNKDTAKRVKKLYTAYRPLESDGTPARDDGYYNHWRGIPVLEGSMASIPDITVDADMFAPEPAEWRKKIVRILFHRREQDQCHFRRRFLFSLALLPVIAVIFTLAKVAFTLFGLIYGVRGFDWRFWQPRYTFTDPFNLFPDGRIKSYWFHHSDGSFRNPIAWLASPPVLVFAPLIVWAIFHIQTHHGDSKRTFPIVDWGWWKTVAIVDGSALSVVALALIIVGLGAVITVLSERLHLGSPFAAANDYWHEQWEDFQDRRSAARTERIYADLETMQCGEDPPPLSLSDLPAEKKTVELRFQALKTRVCKPFAR